LTHPRYAERFIPAGAGNTWSWPSMVKRATVHPRGRGEHIKAPTHQSKAAGSSPRARGTPLADILRQRNQRFIPAGAGNTSFSSSSLSRSAVHPRGRGEHVRVLLLHYCAHGSSPRARGTHVLGHLLSLDWRFIPAGAGNTPSGQSQFPFVTVHPRGRGEHWRRSCRSRSLRGSSPRARGTRLTLRRSTAIPRFIPAGAGNTAFSETSPAIRPVHPRGRGEHASTYPTAWPGCGSSPRARGTPRGHRDEDRHDRFIPAGAGNT